VILLIVKRKMIGFAADRNEIRQLLSFGTGLSMAQVANYFALHSDNLVVGRWLGAGALGIYGRAYHFLVMPANLIGNMADKVLFPAMSSVQTDHVRLRRAYFRTVGIIAMITLPLSGALIVLAPEIVQLVLGPQWSDVVAPFRILAISLVFRTGYKISDSLVRATGAVFRSAWRKVIYAITVFAGAWIGHHWGLVGTAVGVSCAISLHYLLMFHLSLSLLDGRWSQLFNILIRHLVVALAVSGVLAVLKMITGAEGLPVFVTLILSGIVAFGVIACIWLVFRRIYGVEGNWLISIIELYREQLVTYWLLRRKSHGA
jgi:PST family polysaccharide transporter